MSWIVRFHRRAGDPELIIEELDPLFDRLPRFERDPPREVDPLAENEVRFVYTNPISGATFEFHFQTPPESDDELPDDALHQPTALMAVVPVLDAKPGVAELAQEAVPVIVEVCRNLSLTVSDDEEDAVPRFPNEDMLIEAYLKQGAEVTAILASETKRRSRFLRNGCIFLGLALLLVLAMSLGLGR